MDKFSFQGQPQQPHQELATTSLPAGNCSVCNEPPTEQSIRCNKCQKNYHLSCVRLQNKNTKQNFTCDNCTKDRNTHGSPKSVRSHRSKTSTTSTNSTIRRKNLELQRLEEERQLAKERDAEYLKQKYRILQEADEEVDDCSSVDGTSVQEWVNAQTNPSKIAETVHNSANTQDPLTTSGSNQQQMPNNHLQVNMPTAPIQTNSQNINSQAPLNSTPYNHTTTFINKTQTAPAAQSNISQQAPANYTIGPSFSSLPHSSTMSNLTHQQINARQTVPKDLPIFSGNPEEWPLFSSTYDWSTAVCGLTDAENLIRLQRAVRGEALKSIQNILIHPSCVPAAISTLKLLYGQPEKILHALKQKIRSLPTINANKLETITSFAVQVKGLQATIEACGLYEELHNSSLLQELITKLPSYFQLNWGTYKMNLAKQNQGINLSQFTEWIFDIGVSASSVNIESGFSSAAEQPSRNRQNSAHIHTHTDQNKQQCMVCDGDCNNVAYCKKFKEADRTAKWNIVRELNLCKQCLRKHFGKCNYNNACGIDGCQYKHHYLLHKKDEKDDKAETSHKTDQAHSCNTHSGTNRNNLFKIMPVTIYGKDNKFIDTFAFIDDGSSTSLIDEEIVNELNLSGITEPLCLKWTGSVERNEDNSRRLRVNVSGSNKKVHSVEVRTVKQLSLPKQSLDIKRLVQEFPYLTGLPVTGYTDATPRLLIGLNNTKLCVYNNIKEGNVSEPVAIRTRLGWLIFGTMENHSLIEHHHCHIEENGNRILSELMKKFYTLETAGIDNSTTILSKDDEKVLSILKRHTRQRSDGHYETSLLWRCEEIEMPNSYDMALKRYRCLKKKLQNDSRLNDVFNKTISEYIQKGYITKIDRVSPKSNQKERIWYLPIFPVFNKNKPGKTRIVWDAAAKSHGISLNDMLLKGPDMLCSLPSILMRFRQKSIAICGDIEQMFHQVFIRKEDRNAQRFLWGSYSDTEPDIYVMNVMIFGASCSPCISQYIKNVNAYKFSENYPIAAAAIKYNHYVDDYLDSVDTVEDAITLALDVKHIHGDAGFNIRNWICNNKQVLAAINGDDSGQQKSLNLATEIEADKVLGVFWKASNDCFIYKISPNIINNNSMESKIPSKRELLSFLMSIYDPLGLIGNFLMYLKIVLQDVWRSGIGWDEEIQPPEITKWTKWLSFLREIENIAIPRCYLQTFRNYNEVDVQLHTFADASECGYAAVSYFRISDGNDVVVSLVGSRTRVSPLRITSIPRLELMAAVIASRFANNIIKSTSIKVSTKIFWSDSKTVLSWLRSEHKKYHQFVSFRVGEILDTTEVDEWRWVPSKQNVADEATKWSKSGPDLSNNSRWQNGPKFLMTHQSSWPVEVDNHINTDCEIKQHVFHVTETYCLVNIKRFSQYCRVLRAVAYVIHYINKLKNGGSSNNTLQNELNKAEIILIKQAQREEYSEEVLQLKRDGKISKNSCIYKLSAYLDDDEVLRIDGRIYNAVAPDELKHPAIMPKYSYITELIILNFHKKYYHANHETAINEIRQQYYVPRLRTIFKKTIRKCQMCKVNKTLPINPQMARLPRARLSSYVAPFTFTGVDFFGPILVIVNRHKEKRYGALFTCLTIRAIHVEIVHSLSTDSCIMAIRNFMARRGTPREFFSDNGTNFVGAERELRQAIQEVDSNEFVHNFTTASTKWNFNPPCAPHMGGAWERMVRSVKTVFYKITPSRAPNDETLRSMMAEIENTINSRPLTYVPIEDEHQEALTPNHFLLGCSNGMKPLADYNDCGLVLKHNWLYAQQYAQHFWKRWVTEYLPSLTCRTKWFEKSKPLCVGDLVVVVDPSSPRNVWPRGKVLETTIASDGQVRKAKIQTASGVLERPVTKLALIDVVQDKE